MAETRITGRTATARNTGSRMEFLSCGPTTRHLNHRNLISALHIVHMGTKMKTWNLTTNYVGTFVSLASVDFNWNVNAHYAQDRDTLLTITSGHVHGVDKSHLCAMGFRLAQYNLQMTTDAVSVEGMMRTDQNGILPKCQTFHFACKDNPMITKLYEHVEHGTLTHLQVNENIDMLKTREHNYDLEWHAMRLDGSREPT